MPILTASPVGQALVHSAGQADPECVRRELRRKRPRLLSVTDPDVIDQILEHVRREGLPRAPPMRRALP